MQKLPNTEYPTTVETIHTVDFSLIEIKENGRISARNLYQFLELAPAVISRWLESKILKNKFAVESEDWIGFNILVEGNQIQDYDLTPSFAKKLCMMSKSKNGEGARNYFLECEKKALKLELQTQKPLTLLELLELTRESELARIRAEEQLTQANLELTHKQEIILDLTADIPPKEMRKTINEVIRWKRGGYGERWNKLYKQFKYHFSVDIPTRAKHRDMAKLDYAQKENLLTKLYKLSLELFEKDNPEPKNQLQLQN